MFKLRTQTLPNHYFPYELRKFVPIYLFFRQRNYVDETTAIIVEFTKGENIEPDLKLCSS